MRRKALARIVLAVLTAWLACVLTAGSSAQEESDQKYRFEVTVDMVNLSVTVVDENDRLVTDLIEEDFKVYEDGVPQELQVFSQENLPLRMVILLDTSASMQMKMGLAQEAAVQFVQSLKPADQVQVIEFNDRVVTLAEFTSDFGLAAEAIRKTTPRGSTSLYNALYIALRSVAQRRRIDERQAIIVLSDGADTRSLVSFDDVLEVARKTDVMMYAISLRGSDDDLKKQKYFDARYQLSKLAVETGGTAYTPDRIEDLAGVYERIAAELKSQYNLGYLSSNQEADGKWRHLQVICEREGATVKSRTGYFAPRSRRNRTSTQQD